MVFIHVVTAAKVDLYPLSRESVSGRHFQGKRSRVFHLPQHQGSSIHPFQDVEYYRIRSFRITAESRTQMLVPISITRPFLDHPELLFVRGLDDFTITMPGSTTTNICLEFDVLYAESIVIAIDQFPLGHHINVSSKPPTAEHI